MLYALDVVIFSYVNGFVGRSFFGDNLIVFVASALPVLIGILFLVVVGVSLYRKTNGLEVLNARLAEVEAVKIAFVAVVLARAVVFVLQHVFERARPYVTLDTPYLFTVPAWSFPSGHAVVLFALVGAAYRFNRNAAAVLALFSVMVGIARVAAGVHYPTDIVGGALIGFCTGYLGTMFFRYKERRRQKNSVRV